MKRAFGLLGVGGLSAVLILFSASHAVGQPTLFEDSLGDTLPVDAGSGISTLTPTLAPPEILRNYRFLPRHSILHVGGGFAGFDIDANIFGRYGLVTGFHHDFGPSLSSLSLEPFAKFVDVRARAINPTDFGPYSFDLDETLNLSGLKGKPLPLFFPAVLPNIQVFKFRGEEGQGAPFEMHAVTIGRWMFMKGANDAPCCDFFDYEIRAIARQVPFADIDHDDRVTASDLTRWENDFGETAVDGLSGDIDVDGDVDGLDFLSWQRQRGETMPSIEEFDAVLASALAASSGSAASAVTTAVPEPSSLMLAGMFVGVLLLRRRS